MKSILKTTLLFLNVSLGVLILQGCVSYKVSTQSFIDNPCPSELAYNKEEALNHCLYTVIPRHRSQIRWYDIGHWSSWMLLGNDDDGIFGEEPTAAYRPDQPANGYKALCWQMRNPLHNFTHYVIGTAYWPNSELALIKVSEDNFDVLRYRPSGGCNFASEGTSFFLGFHGWKPFISLRIKYASRYRSDFYLGWRNRGNFGIKFNFLSKSLLNKKNLQIYREHQKGVENKIFPLDLHR